MLQSFDQEFKPGLDEIAKLAREVKQEVTLAAIKALQQEQCLQAHERKESSRSRSLLRRYIPSADEDRRVIQSRHSSKSSTQQARASKAKSIIRTRQGGVACAAELL